MLGGVMWMRTWSMKVRPVRLPVGLDFKFKGYK